MSSLPRDPLAAMLLAEQAKIRKLEIIFGPWWRHYAVPYEFTATLFQERSSCPYCDGALGLSPLSLQCVPGESEGVEPAHLDHMDPLSSGGEESVRNAIYVCALCNLAKGRRLFVDWLRMLRPERQSLVRLIYEEKHGHAPEAFVSGPKQPRMTRPRLELALNERVLRVFFRKPIVSGPPQRATSD